MNRIVIFGAGKIARGFVNHLLAISKFKSVFIEKSVALCELINERGEYGVNILGNPQKNMKIKDAKAIKLDEFEQAVKAVAETNLIFTAVGGKNLKEIVPVIAKGFQIRLKEGNITPLNLITCENWKKPADLIKIGVKELLNKEEQEQLDKLMGFSEAVVMRSAIEPNKEALILDPLIVNVQDFWSLIVDAQRLVGEIPSIKGIELMENFGGFLERKFYTYNAANGTVSFVGSILGYKYIAEASRDEFVTGVLEKVYKETSEALCKKHGIALKEQQQFAQSSYKKLRDENIVDTLERNARDPVRKLSYEDRLIGPARLMMDYGVKPDGILTSIACAIYYNGVDETAIELKRIRSQDGVDAVLNNVCGIDPDSELGKLIKERIKELVKKCIIKEKVLI